jgi:subtilase family serine protease
MRPGKASLVIPVLLALLSTLAFAVQPDRISGAIDSDQVTTLRGNVHGMARPEFDLGRTNGGQLVSGLSLVFNPSPAQQKALDRLLSDQQNSTSPNYHKWLTPARFADRFGMSRNDIQKVTSWLQSQGFRVVRIANSRNQVFFEGTISQIETTFRTEMHDYLVDGEIHFANATAPSVPAAFAGLVLGIQNLHNFQPRPRLHPHFTSHVSGGHFIAPGDFATIYDVQGLYSTGSVDGSGQKIAVTGQSAINLTDVAHYRSAAGLAAKAPTLTLVPGTGPSTTCPGDEGESDLDVEFSGGVAKNASIILVYAGLGTGTTCNNRTAGAFDALQYAVDQNIAPIISNSYGSCEAAVGSSFALTMQGWAKQANSQGQTIISATGDSGAADCDFHVKSATQGLAVDLPAAIPEVTGAGGTEFNANVDPAGVVSGTPPNTNAAATAFWSGTTGSADTLSSALSYIPEVGWNDTAFDIAHGGFISASGGGKSVFFLKPTWQTGTGVPNDGQRDVPDISVSASADHDGYLFCSEDGPNGTKVSTCTSGFRDAGGNLAVVGGTSAAAPTLSGLMALFNQFFGNTPPNGLGNINPSLYKFAASNPNAFNDVTTGNNIVPCTQGTSGCPASAPFQYGFNAGTGYDQVTGLGSINAFTLAQAWFATIPHFTLSPSPNSLSTSAGQSTGQTTITVTPQNGFSGNVSFTCSGLPSGATCNFTSINSTSSTLVIQTSANMSAASAISVTVKGTSGSISNTTTVTLTVTPTTEKFALAASPATLSLQPGETTANTVNLAVSDPGNTGFIVNNQTVIPLSYTCSVTPAASEGPTCTFSPSAGQNVSILNPTVAIVTIAPTTKLYPPFKRRGPIFYAMLLPGVLGIALAAGSRPRGLRLLTLITVLGFSTLWLSSCGGSSNTQKNPGTPPGSYKMTVNATTGGASPLTSSASFTVTVQ